MGNNTSGLLQRNFCREDKLRIRVPQPQVGVAAPPHSLNFRLRSLTRFAGWRPLHHSAIGRGAEGQLPRADAHPRDGAQHPIPQLQSRRCAGRTSGCAAGAQASAALRRKVIVADRVASLDADIDPRIIGGVWNGGLLRHPL